MQNLFKPLTAEGAALANLGYSLYSPDAAVKAEERAALAENKRMDTALKKAQIDEYARKKQAGEDRKRMEAEAISNMVRGLMGGTPQGNAVMDYRNAGGVQPNTLPQVDDDGISLNQPPTIPMARPAGYTPQLEDTINRLSAGFYGAQALGDKNFTHVTQGAGQMQNQNWMADVIAGALKPETLAATVAAGKGSSFYKDNQGRVLNEYSGALSESGPQAVANVGATSAKAGADTALAGQRTADAGLKRAQTGAILPNQTVTTDQGATVPVSGSHLSKAVVDSMFPKNGAGGKPPKDFRWNATSDQLEVIPGSQTDFKRRDAVAKETAKKKVLDSTLDAEIANIDKLIGTEDGQIVEHPGLTSAVGSIDALIPSIAPDTVDAEALIQSLQSKASISSLQTIRSTAGAVGSLTEKEWPRLESMKATLQTRQSAPQFRQSLRDYRNELLRIKRVAAEEMAREAQSVGNAPAPQGVVPPPPGMAPDGAPRGVVTITNDAEWKALAPGTQFRAPDGSIRVK